MNHRQRDRLSEACESRQDARKRTEIENEKRREGKWKVLDHVGRRENYCWNKEGCLKEVSEYAQDHLINFTGLARKYELKNKEGKLPNNAGQVMKELLKENNVNVEQFRYWAKRPAQYSLDATRVRRKKLRYVFLVGNKISLFYSLMAFCAECFCFKVS